MPPLVSSLLLMKLKEGVYENLISDRLLDDMRQSEAAGYVCHTESIDTAESAKMLADFVSDAIHRKLEDADVPVEDKKDGFGNTSPYYCMGLLDYVSSHGNYPMNIEWELRKPAIAKFIKAV